MRTAATVVTNLAAMLNELKASMLGGLIALGVREKKFSCFASFQEIKTYLPNHSNFAMGHGFGYCTEIPDGYVRV